MTKILITGANGFFGKNLFEAWYDRYELVGIDLPPELFGSARTKLNPIIYVCDIREDSHLINQHLKGVDIVIHCAARARIEPSWREFKDYYDTNITASQTLFRMCQLQGVKRFIYFSSSSVYGNNGCVPQKESDPLCPTNPYAVSKMAAEAALRVQALQGDTELIIVRPFTMYGDYMSFGTYGLVIAKFIRAYQKGEPLMLDGGGDQTRDFVHVSDAINALELIMNKGGNGEVYNIGSGTVVSVKDLANCVSDRQVITPLRTGAVDTTHADITKLIALGYQPKERVLYWLTDHMKQHILVKNS